MTESKMEDFRELLRHELIDELKKMKWDEDKMYDLAQCLLGKEHLLTSRLKSLMEEIHGPIMD